MSTTPKDGDDMADQTTAEIATYFRVLDGTESGTRTPRRTPTQSSSCWHRGQRRCGRTGGSGIRSVALVESWRSTCPDSATLTSPND